MNSPATELLERIEDLADDSSTSSIGRAEVQAGVTDAEFFDALPLVRESPSKTNRAVKGRTSSARNATDRLVQNLLARAAGPSRRRKVGDRHAGKKPALCLCSALECPAAFQALIEAWGRESLRAKRPSTRFLQSLEKWISVARLRRRLSVSEALVLFEIVLECGDRLPGSLAAAALRLCLTVVLGKNTPGETTSWLDEERFGGHATVGAIRAAEVRWHGALLFPSIPGADVARIEARVGLQTLLTNSTDKHGVPKGDLLPELPDWLIALVRARLLGRRFGRPLFDSVHEKRFRGLVSASLRLARENGQFPLAATGMDLSPFWSLIALGATGRPAAEAARLASASQKSRRIGRPSRRSKRGPARVSGRPPKPFLQSDASCLASLCGDPSLAEMSLLVSHAGEIPILDLSVQGRVLFRGEWGLKVRVGGHPVIWQDGWKCSCSYTSEEGSYLELFTRSSQGVRCERQVLLPRDDGPLFLCDAILVDEGMTVEYAARLPIVAGWEARETNTRALAVRSTKMGVRVYPLGLACDRGATAHGQLHDDGEGLQIRRSSVGSLWNPLVIDWAAVRQRMTPSWRALTVAQNGTPLPSHQAAAYRLQVGSEQWMLFRGLTRALEPRSVLGQHSMYETMIGRFLPGGKFDPIVLVEQSAQTG